MDSSPSTRDPSSPAATKTPSPPIGPGRRLAGTAVALTAGALAALLVVRFLPGAFGAALPARPGTFVVEGRLDPAEDPTLPQDGSLYEDHRIPAEAGYRLTASMESDDFDAWIQVFGPDGRPLGQNDDGPDGGTDAWLSLPCERPGTYVVRANARTAGMTGDFRLIVVLESPATDGDP